MDTYATPGIYAVASDAIAKNIQNCPAGTAGTLVVEYPIRSNDYYIMQSYYTYDRKNRYVRMKNTGSSWSNWELQPTRSEVDALKNVLSPTLSGCGSGSSIHAVQIGTVVVVTAKIEYSGANVTISGLPAHNGDVQNGFAIIARDQNDGSVARMWTNGSRNILKVDNLTENHLYGLSYTYIIA